MTPTRWLTSPLVCLRHPWPTSLLLSLLLSSAETHFRTPKTGAPSLRVIPLRHRPWNRLALPRWVTLPLPALVYVASLLLTPLMRPLPSLEKTLPARMLCERMTEQTGPSPQVMHPWTTNSVMRVTMMKMLVVV